MVTFSPFMQSATAQDIINSYINKPYQTPPAINPIFDLREPGQEFPPLNPPVQTDPVVDPCPPGYQLIDGVCQPIDQFGGDMPNETTGGGDNENIDTRTESEKILDDMTRSQDNMFGATRFLDKYEAGVDEFGNPIFEFEDQTFTPTLGGIFDAFTGGNARRRNKFNTAVNTVLAQTSNPNFYGQNFNPLAFGFRNGDIFTMYNPQNYLNQVRGVMLDDGLTKGTVGDMLGSIGNAAQGVNIVDDQGKQVYSTPTQQVNTGQKGTEPVDVRGSSLVVTDDGVRRRDDTAYQSAVAKNIARNVANQGQTKFSKTLGGFYGGR